MCEVVYDGIGKTTFPASLDCLKPLGYFVSYGSASGQIDAFNINILQTKGSLFATRPTLNTYAAKHEDLISIANGLFDVVGKGGVKIPINQRYALKDAVKAHRDLEGRATTGSSILVPWILRRPEKRLGPKRLGPRRSGPMTIRGRAAATISVWRRWRGGRLGGG